MPGSGDDHTGARIKRYRKLARLSQRQLTARIPYSYSLLNQVECGARTASAELIAAVAGALGIDPSVLTEPQHVRDLRSGRLAAMLRPVREALDLYDLTPGRDVEAPPLPVLVAQADKVCQSVRATHLRIAARELPDLIAWLTAIAYFTPSDEAWRALASCYRSAHDVALKLGQQDLSALALDRMGWAAERGSDPCLAAIRQYKRALSHQESGRQLGRRLVAAGHDLLGDPVTREEVVVAGQLHLGASAVAARAGDRAAVADHIAAARDLAERVGGEAREVHWLSFGRVNTALHEMGAAITMKDFDDALGKARALKLPPSTLTSRRARFLVDRALAEMETGYAGAALRHLVEARKAAPEQTRYHPRTREAITGLLKTTRQTPDGLVRMAAWVGL
ncbi:helix-turn-helix domain-containing protein [Streptomyces sp. NPDC017941]|uniref:helix-turn-helix domain-containing protein n=1 Tax=Streptomyces sp. NPDC017941 TaxID=3365018 RepID=UPI0037BA971C